MQNVFQWNKLQLISDDVLVTYSSKQKLILVCDALLYGVAAVISHIMDD